MPSANPGQDDYRLGSILYRLGLIATDHMQQALDVALLARLPLGKVLLMQERLTAATLRIVVDAQWMIKDGVLNERDAFSAVHLARRNAWNLSDALIALGIEAYPDKGVRLGELLVKTRVISKDNLTQELEYAAMTGLPLGRVAVARGKLGEGTIWHSVKLQNAVRTGKIEFNTAVKLLERINEDLICSSFKLGELLVAAKKLDKSEVDVAVKMSVSNEKQTGDVLLEMGWIEDSELKRALAIQTLLRSNRIDYHQAIEYIRSGFEIEALEEMTKTAFVRELAISFYEFLKLSGYFSRTKLEETVTKLASDKNLLTNLVGDRYLEEAKEAVKQIFDDPRLLSRALEATFPEDRQRLGAAKAALARIEKGRLTVEEGLIEYVAALAR